MSEGSELERTNRLMLRARDAMDRDHRQPLDIPRLAEIACASEAHFIRTFKATFGETPHRYLQRRRIERAMFLLRTSDADIWSVCTDVGFASLGTFGRTFRDIVGETPSAYRARGPLPEVPNCFVSRWARPSSLGDRPLGSTTEEVTADQPATEADGRSSRLVLPNPQTK